MVQASISGKISLQTVGGSHSSTPPIRLCMVAMASHTSSIPFAKSRATLVSTATSLGGLSIGAIGNAHRALQEGFAFRAGQLVALGADFRRHARAPSPRLTSAA